MQFLESRGTCCLYGTVLSIIASNCVWMTRFRYAWPSCHLDIIPIVKRLRNTFNELKFCVDVIKSIYSQWSSMGNHGLQYSECYARIEVRKYPILRDLRGLLKSRSFIVCSYPGARLWVVSEAKAYAATMLPLLVWKLLVVRDGRSKISVSGAARDLMFCTTQLAGLVSSSSQLLALLVNRLLFSTSPPSGSVHHIYHSLIVIC